MALAHTCSFSASLKFGHPHPPIPMTTINLTFSAKTLTHPHNPKTPILNFNRVSPHSIRARTRTRNPIRIRAVLDEDYSSKRSSSSEQRETIMLPGCDYNHWLIVMEFPKDPAPTREQMIDTYLQTLATVLGRFSLSFPYLASDFIFIAWHGYCFKVSMLPCRSLQNKLKLMYAVYLLDEFIIYNITWRNALAVICDRKVPLELERKFYFTSMRHTMLYESLRLNLGSKEPTKCKLWVVEMKILWWMNGH